MALSPSNPVRWADLSSSEDEDLGPARSYCEVLRSGTPPETPPPHRPSPPTPISRASPLRLGSPATRLASIVVRPDGEVEAPPQAAAARGGW